MNVTRDKRATRWDSHRRTRRAELVNSALAAIRAHGAGVGMDEVAARAGTSKTVVYRHFADRAALHAAVCARVAEILTDQIRAAMASAATPREQVAAGVEAYLRLIEQDPDVYRFVVHRPLVSQGPGDDPLADLVSLMGDDAAAVIGAQLTAAPAAARTWGHAIVGLVRGAGDAWLAHPGGLSRADVTAQITDFAWSGLSGLVPEELS
jgi:AcrR family transcriptional regulator